MKKKTCIKCEIEKDITEFHHNSKGGHYAKCKICKNEYEMKIKKKNNEGKAYTTELVNGVKMVRNFDAYGLGSIQVNKRKTQLDTVGFRV